MRATPGYLGASVTEGWLRRYQVGGMLLWASELFDPKQEFSGTTRPHSPNNEYYRIGWLYLTSYSDVSEQRFGP